jgi:hypothetical protein
VDIDRRRLQVDWFLISDRRDRNATARREVSYVTRVNSNRVERVSTGVDG